MPPLSSLSVSFSFFLSCSLVIDAYTHAAITPTATAKSVPPGLDNAAKNTVNSSLERVFRKLDRPSSAADDVGDSRVALLACAALR